MCGGRWLAEDDGNGVVGVQVDKGLVVLRELDVEDVATVFRVDECCCFVY